MNKIEINDIIYKEEESSFEEKLNNISLLLEDNKNNNKNKPKSFEDVLSETKQKFQNLIKNIKEKKISNNYLDKIIKDNIHLQYIFKNKNLGLYNINTIPNNIELKNNFKNIEKNNYTYISIEETKETNTVDKNFKSNKRIQENIKANINIKNENLINYNKNSSSEKLEKITGLEGIKCNSKNNKSNPNLNNMNNNNKSFICKKRYREEKDMNNKYKTDIFNKIKELYNIYNKSFKSNNKEISIYQIHEDNYLFFKKSITIIENKIPICVIYFNHEFIKKIYLIREQIFIEDENDIFEVLEKIKNNIEKLLFKKI